VNDDVAGAAAAQAARLASVRAAVAAAAVAAGRSAADVVIVGASKYQNIDVIVAAYDAGLKDFGENYAAELRDKRAAFSQRRPDAKDVRWHFIGMVQRGNAKLIAAADLVHGVGAVGQADALNAARARLDAATGCGPLDVLIQINAAGEASKNGVAIADVDALAAHVGSLPALRLQGLMTMPAFDDDDALADAFGAVAAKARALGLPIVSMGMSGDFAIAVAAGATMVRVGTRLFGPRPAAPPPPSENASSGASS